MKTNPLVSTLAIGLFAVLVLSAVGPTGFAEDSGPRVTDHSEGKGLSSDDHSGPKDGQNQSSKGRDDGQPQQAGRLVQSGGHVEGRYVNFTFDSSSCTIRDYRVYGVLFWSTIQLPSPCKVQRGNDGGSGDKGDDSHGATVRIEGAQASIKIQDTPNGHFEFKTSNSTSVRLTAASGAALKLENATVDVGVGNLTGLLRGNEHKGNVSLSGSAVDASGAGTFWVHPESGSSPDRQAIRDAIKDRHVAGEVDILVDNGTVSSQVLTYDDVVIKVSKSNQSSFRFLVDANLTSGRVFAIHLGPGLFEHDRIGVQYFDLDSAGLPVTANITKADSLQDVLDIQPGEGAEYWIIHDEAGTHALVAVPHFSGHVFQLDSLPAQVLPVVVYGLVFGIVMVALGVAGLAMGRRTE